MTSSTGLNASGERFRAAGDLGERGPGDELGVPATWRIQSKRIATPPKGADFRSFKTTATDQATQTVIGEITTSGRPSAKDVMGMVQRAASPSAASGDAGENAASGRGRLPGTVIIDHGWHQEETELRQGLNTLGVLLRVEGTA